MKKALERGVVFEILVGPSYDRESKFVLENLNVFVMDRDPIKHFIVVDSRHARVVTRNVSQVGFHRPTSSEKLLRTFLEFRGKAKLHKAGALA